MQLCRSSPRCPDSEGPTYHLRRGADSSTSGEDTLAITASEYLDLGANNQFAPYVRHRVRLSQCTRPQLARVWRTPCLAPLLRLAADILLASMCTWLAPHCAAATCTLSLQGEQTFTFSLVYTSTEEVLPQLDRLLAVARLDNSKQGIQQASQQLSAIIQASALASQTFVPGESHVDLMHPEAVAARGHQQVPQAQYTGLLDCKPTEGKAAGA